MRKVKLGGVLFLFSISIAQGRNAAALKADLESILPEGKTSVRVAYIKGGKFTEFASGANNTAVYVASSEDGQIRRLYPASGEGRYFNVNITADGKRVFFYNGTSGNIVVVNWDGSNAKTVNVGGFACEYWRNPKDGSDWAIVERGGMSRVNIDQPTQVVQIGPMAAGGDGCGLSDDGTIFMYFDYNRNPAAFGVCAVPGFQFTAGPHGGCQGSLSGGSSPYYNHNPSGHTAMCVHEVKNQDNFTVYEVVKATKQVLQQKGLTGSCYGDNNEGTRFAQHPNFATFMIGNSKVNPILMRLPDMKFVYIEDELPCTYCGDMDAVFLPYSGIGTSVTIPREHDGCVSFRDIMQKETYLPDGRRIGSKPLYERNSSSFLIISRQNKSGTSGLRPLIADHR